MKLNARSLLPVLLCVFLLHPIVSEYSNNIVPNVPSSSDSQSYSSSYASASVNPLGFSQTISLSGGGTTAYPYGVTCPPNQYICAGACSPFYPCLTAQYCSSTGGYIIGVHCYMCPTGQSLYNGSCIDPKNVKCGKGQTFDGFGCVCAKKYLAFGASCVLSCGENAYVLGNQCTCLPGHTLYNGKCISSRSLCQIGLIYSNGKCTCPPGQLQVGQFSCVPTATTACLGGVWNASSNVCVCPWYLYLDIQTFNCVPCNTADRQISINGTCVCGMNYRPAAQGCSACPSGQYYEPSAGSCVQNNQFINTPCLPTQYRDMNNYYQCTPCPIQCVSCTGPTQCSVCAAGYIIQSSLYQSSSYYPWGYPSGSAPYSTYSLYGNNGGFASPYGSPYGSNGFSGSNGYPYNTPSPTNTPTGAYQLTGPCVYGQAPNIYAQYSQFNQQGSNGYGGQYGGFGIPITPNSPPISPIYNSIQQAVPQASNIYTSAIPGFYSPANPPNGPKFTLPLSETYLTPVQEPQVNNNPANFLITPQTQTINVQQYQQQYPQQPYYPTQPQNYGPAPASNYGAPAASSYAAPAPASNYQAPLYSTNSGAPTLSSSSVAAPATPSIAPTAMQTSAPAVTNSSSGSGSSSSSGSGSGN